MERPYAWVTFLTLCKMWHPSRSFIIWQAGLCSGSVAIGNFGNLIRILQISTYFQQWALSWPWDKGMGPNIWSFHYYFCSDQEPSELLTDYCKHGFYPSKMVMCIQIFSSYPVKIICNHVKINIQCLIWISLKYRTLTGAKMTYS